MNPLAQLTDREFFEATQAVDEFERQLEAHPLRDKWAPHLMTLVVQVEVALGSGSGSGSSSSESKSSILHGLASSAGLL